MSEFIPNSFQLPNCLVDGLMSVLTGNEFKCLILIIRKTRGWHKERDYISISQFMDYTGVKSKKTLYDALGSLTDRGLITVDKTRGRMNGYRLSRLFEVAALNVDKSVDKAVDKPVAKNATSIKNATTTSSKNCYPTKDTINKIHSIARIPAGNDQRLIKWAIENGFSSPEGYRDWESYRRKLESEMRQRNEAMQG